MIPGCLRIGTTLALRFASLRHRYATMQNGAVLEVRRATPNDANALAALRYAFRSSIGIAVEVEEAFVARCAAWMRSRLADDTRWRVWILEAAAQPIGNIWLQLIEKLPNPVEEPETHGYVTNFFVRPEYRGDGGGSRLLKAALAECGASSVDTIILWPTPQSRSLYERHGFSVTEAVMTRVL
jgi:GNAT superfamily N-acetyltransferase